MPMGLHLSHDMSHQFFVGDFLFLLSVSVPNAGTDYMVERPRKPREVPGFNARFRFGGIAQSQKTSSPTVVGTLAVQRSR